MLAIILAAGRGSRMGDLTKDTPKPMLKVGGKTLIDWKLEALPEAVDEIVLVVGYQAHKIYAHFGDRWQGKKITYVAQADPLGTGHALLLCKGKIETNEKTIVLMGDDIYARRDLAALVRIVPSMLVSVPIPIDPKRHWQVFVNEYRYVEHIAENPEAGRWSEFINAGAYCIDMGYFAVETQKGGAGEYSIPHTVLALVEEYGLRFHAVQASSWIQIVDAKSIAAAEKLIKGVEV